jgi:hypothetical protein
MSQARRSSLVIGPLLVLCLGCGDNTGPALQPATPGPTPTGPPTSSPPVSPPVTPPPSAATGLIWGQVLDSSGVCLDGGVVQIVAGPGAGRLSGQPDGCDAWDYVGFELRDLPLGAMVTLRASAPGHRSEDRQLVTPAGGGPVQFVLVPE